MRYQESNIENFFRQNITFSIPVYQRAYSWKKEQWNTFWEDLEVQNGSENEYSFGNILLETVINYKKYDIIDGQQRITTIIIFMRSLINVLKERNFDYKEIEENFIKDSKGIKKLDTTDLDSACFGAEIINNENYDSICSPSQKNIVEAKKFFYEKLKAKTTEELLKIKDIIYSSKIITIYIDNKKEAALTFELQNNRGCDLTNMEKLKSYFIYQAYIYCSKDEVESKITDISNNFKEIYRKVNDILPLNEDSLLLYHCQAHFEEAFSSRGFDDIKTKLKNVKNDKIGWIYKFLLELINTFSYIKLLSDNDDEYLIKLRKIRNDNKKLPAYLYPFIIKGYKLFNADKNKLHELFHLLEILAVRDSIIKTRADLNSRLTDILNEFNGDIEHLRVILNKKLNDAFYWSNERFNEELNNITFMDSTRNIIRYILGEYENSLQKERYKIDIDNTQIEHISPQTPNEYSYGYEVSDNNDYSDEFREKYLNNIGNLMLISGPHNASIGNICFSEKLKTYKNNLLKQQAEIVTFLTDGKEEWKSEQIIKRRDKIVEMAMKRWSFLI